MSWAGIANDSEFYSDHYLSEVFAKNTKELLERWRDAVEVQAEATTGTGVQTRTTPDAHLRSLAQPFTGVLSDLERARSVRANLEAQRPWLQQLCDALCLPWEPSTRELDDDLVLPLLGELCSAEGKPLVWMLEALPMDALDADLLELPVMPEQVFESGDIPLPKAMRGESWQSLLGTLIYTRDDAPRWVVLMSACQCLLLDRVKFAQGRLLRFDWQEILGRREPETLRATAVLLHRDALIPNAASGAAYSLHDTLDENAHKHAYGVSEDLKFALRESIELLGNEAAHQLIAIARQRKEGIYSGENELDPAQLTGECLRYMYRLLFLFYIEARPELGYAPTDDATFLSGYSLEHLRALELVELTSERERNGTYLHDSIATLFRLIDQGFERPVQTQIGTDVDAFTIKALKSHLFDPRRTALLNTVVFPNHVLQRVIELMSLTRRGQGRKRRGRVSYAQLGINQLGAVYEALLSFRGFFAKEELFEVKKKDTSPTALETGYFVNADALSRYDVAEKVFERDARGDQQLKRFPKGSFIYRMAGRDRQQSASYYTPEVLTQCLVKYALKELFAQQLDPLLDDAARARHLLTMTVCEPAMGSAAFLNEAVNQLSDKYLELAQSAKKELIPQSQYAAERQKVKMYLADHAVFGIDLNPVAVELAEVSLWLNALSDDRFVPWFGMQLFCGNSLVGARRQTYPVSSLARAGKKDADSWLNNAPQDLPLNEALPEEHVWHFLLPDAGMAKYDDKAIKERYPEAIKAINEWRKGFTKKFDKEEISRLKRLSHSIDALWQEHANQLAELRASTTDRYAIYGFKDDKATSTTLAFKDEAHDRKLLAMGERNSNAYRRLKLVMDYWCVLWFWPIDQYEDLPSREEWLFDLENLLLGDTVGDGPRNSSDDFFNESSATAAGSFVDRFGEVVLKRLFQVSPRFGLANKLAESRRFFHWSLEFADIFRERGGFDLVLGNPPWIKVEWEEGGVLGDTEPQFVLRKYSATKLRALREQTFTEYPELKQRWLDEFAASEGMQNYLNAMPNYPELKGIQTNLYKCFLPQAWRASNDKGVSAFLHPEGVFDDPKGGVLRAKLYARLRRHFQFVNELQLFEEVHHQTLFGISVYAAVTDDIRIESISNLFHPVTIEHSYISTGQGPVPGIKRQDELDGVVKSAWDLAGHSDRILKLGSNELALFATFYDDAGTPAEQARLPALHSVQLVSVLEKFAKHPRRLGDLKGDYLSLEMWHETNQQDDCTIRRETRFPESPDEWVLSGPHFFVGTPLYKTPRAVCDTNLAYDPIDLTAIPDDYLPRINYVPACSPDEYRSRIPRVPWVEEGESEGRRVTEFYRLAYRAMIPNSGERSLTCAIVPHGIAHTHGVRSYLFRSTRNLLSAAVSHVSLPFDFMLKSTGKTNLHQTLDAFAFLDQSLSDQAIWRLLRLVSVTSHYSQLWSFSTSLDSYVSVPTESDLTDSSLICIAWASDCAFRTSFSRRRALLEIDVLVCLAMSLKLNDLLAIYRVQFPVMRQYEAETFYDQTGRIIFTPSKGLSNVGLPRKARPADLRNGIRYGLKSDNRTESNIALGWEDVRDLRSGTVTKTFMDDTLPNGPHERTIEYIAPFFRPDREEDYRVAWEFFESRLAKDGAS